MNLLTNTTCSVEDMYRMYNTNVKQYFLKYTHDEMRAEDMTHDLFMKLLLCDDIIMPQTALALIFTIASRMVASDARHYAFVRRVMMNYNHSDFYEDTYMACKEIADIEQEKIRQLPTKMRAVYIAIRFEGKKIEEVAKEMKTKKRTVESHLFVARKEVREYVSKAIAEG